ncbi:hypothetical protein Rsub_13292 [Raphidocelis subcapitata]|uniref:Uncharacterized protein n=1 Tax=Raphidocelis subcapitata TaxID=307507 RepID=A0A2V0PQQ7_9CHLO|nr:hypothetical protein Rsub_13292 [Raphidocelis subcapitata]|eukprot:GBG00534.1 hypothetical protein Rsub_13292 [Raphidocelis subcapitata]
MPPKRSGSKKAAPSRTASGKGPSGVGGGAGDAGGNAGGASNPAGAAPAKAPAATPAFSGGARVSTTDPGLGTKPASPVEQPAAADPEPGPAPALEPAPAPKAEPKPAPAPAAEPAAEPAAPKAKPAPEAPEEGVGEAGEAGNGAAAAEAAGREEAAAAPAAVAPKAERVPSPVKAQPVREAVPQVAREPTGPKPKQPEAKEERRQPGQPSTEAAGAPISASKKHAEGSPRDLLNLITAYIKTAAPSGDAAADAAAAAPCPAPRRAVPLAAELLPPAPQLPDAALRALSAFRALYVTEAAGEAGREALLRGSYAPGATFEDNLMRVVGPDDIGVQFYALSRLCRRVELEIVSVQTIPAGDVAGGPASWTASALDALLRAAGAAGAAAWALVAGGAPADGGAAAATGKGGEVLGLRIVNVQRYYLPSLLRNFLTSAFLPEHLDLWVTSDLLVTGGTGDGAGTVLEHHDSWLNAPKLPWALRRAVGLGSSVAMRTLLRW